MDFVTKFLDRFGPRLVLGLEATVERLHVQENLSADARVEVQAIRQDLATLAAQFDMAARLHQKQEQSLLPQSSTPTAGVRERLGKPAIHAAERELEITLPSYWCMADRSDDGHIERSPANTVCDSR